MATPDPLMPVVSRLARPPLLLAALLMVATAQAGDRIRLDDLGRLSIDRTEVTIAQFLQFVLATGTVTEAEKAGGGFEFVAGWERRPGWNWQRPDGVTPSSERLPAVHVTHAEAASYCAWAGGRLPTAAEWRRAAYTELRASPPAPWTRGQTYAYPTGNSPAGANTSDPADPWPRAAPAGATREGVNGLFDMGANVWEWAADVRGSDRPTMGGSWWYAASQMRAQVDAWKPADFHAVYIGFRCVYEGLAP